MIWDHWILCNGDIKNIKIPNMMPLSCTSPCKNHDNLVLPFPVAKVSQPYASTQIPNWGLFQMLSIIIVHVLNSGCLNMDI